MGLSKRIAELIVQNQSINPKNIIMIPLTCDKIVAFLLKKEPRVVAKAPKLTKTKEKPSTNCNDPIIREIWSFLFKENIAR